MEQSIRSIKTELKENVEGLHLKKKKKKKK